VSFEIVWDTIVYSTYSHLLHYADDKEGFTPRGRDHTIMEDYMGGASYFGFHRAHFYGPRYGSWVYNMVDFNLINPIRHGGG